MSVLIIFSRSSFIQRGKNNFSPNFPGFPGVCVARGQNFVKSWEFKNNWKNSLEVFSFTCIYFKHEKKKKKTEKIKEFNRQLIPDIWDALRNLVPFMQFKKYKKHPWINVTFSKVAGFRSSKGVFHVFSIVQMVPDRVTRHR